MHKPVPFIFKARNYWLILASLVLLACGFIFMSGSSNGGSNSFKGDIFNFRKLTLAPLILISGYSVMIFAIMSVPRKLKNRNND